MSDLALNIIINVIIGIIVIVGFFGFWAKSSGALSENGVIYEYFKKRKTSKKSKKSKKSKQ